MVKRSAGNKRSAETARRLRRVQVLLERMYGRRAWKRRGSGLNVLIEAMLAQNTNMANAARGYAMLRRRFGSWTRVMDAAVGDVQREIAICGLARMRARRMQDLLRTIKRRHGRLSLEFLVREPAEAAFAYLTGFHGIGPKTAAFTLLFAFDAAVLPVDNGILRVVRRLRLVRPAARDSEAERTLSPLIARRRHYPMHTLLFRHAKERCRPRNPECHECALLEVCPWGQRVVKHRPPDPADEAVSRHALRRVIRLSGFASAGVARRGERERKG